jgi:hypothetical protein
LAFGTRHREFRNRKQVGSYTGCCPGVYASSGLVRYGNIDKHGNPHVRTWLIEAVWRLIRAYGKGLETDAAVKEAFNTTLDQIQLSFDARLAHYAAIRCALSPEIAANLTLDDLKKLAVSNPDSSRAMELARTAEAVAQRHHAPERASKILRPPTATPECVCRADRDEQGTRRARFRRSSGREGRLHRRESARKLARSGAAGDAARDRGHTLAAELDPFDVRHRQPSA